MQPPPRIHHYIPIFWTRQWAGADGRVERFRKFQTVVDQRVPPARVGWERNLYTVPDVAPERAQLLEEQLFKHIDDAAAVALHKMLTTPLTPLDDRDVSAWATFILALLHRTPENLRITKLAGKAVWDNAVPEVRERYLEIRKDGDPATFEDYAAQRSPIEAEQSLLWSLPHLIVNPTIGAHLCGMHWATIDIPFSERTFLLSDDALGRSNGIAHPGGHFAMPLSPTRLLVIAWERETVMRFNRMPKGQLVKAMNKWTVESARHFVVGTTLSQAGYIRANFGAFPKLPFNAGVVDQIRAEYAATIDPG